MILMVQNDILKAIIGQFDLTATMCVVDAFGPAVHCSAEERICGKNSLKGFAESTTVTSHIEWNSGSLVSSLQKCVS